MKDAQPGIKAAGRRGQRRPAPKGRRFGEASAAT